VYDWGHAIFTVDPVRGDIPDQKLNASLDCERDGLINIVRATAPDKRDEALTGSKHRVVYRNYLTAKGLKKVTEAFNAMNREVPSWLSDPVRPSP
jgi:hypothetical protein